MKFYEIILMVLFTAFTANIAFTQNEGGANTGLSFLKQGVGARSISMGEAFSSITDDATAVVYNPSRLNYGAKTNVVLMHSSSMLDMTNDFIAAKFSLGKLAFGVGVIVTSISGIEIRTRPGEPIDKFDSKNLSAGLSLGYSINKNLSIGITSKFLYEKIYIDDATGLGFDIGTNYTKDNLSISFVVSNIGSMNELRNSSTKLPTSVRFGGGYLFNVKNFTINLAAEGFKTINGGKLHIHSGGEVGFKDFIFARLGYQTNYEGKGFTSGIGLKYKSISLDYSFVPGRSSVGSNNAFSLGINF